MFKSISDFLKRHRRKILITSGIITTGVLLKRYAQHKFSEWEARQTQNYLDQFKKHHHFEGTMQTCDNSVLSLAPKVRQEISKILNTDALLMELKTNPTNKVQIWEDVKVLVFSQVIGEIVCECLLAVFLRVQLSVLGGYMFIETQKNPKLSQESTDQCSLASTNVQQKYLSQINHFITNGISQVMVPVLASVRPIIGEINLKTSLKLSNFEQELSSIKARLLTSELFQSNFITHCFLEREISAQNQPSCSKDFIIHKMLNETKEILESSDFERITTICMNKGLSKVLDILFDCYSFLASESSNNFSNPNELEVPLAKLIPCIRSVLNKKNPRDLDSFINQVLQIDVLKNFSANIYEAFSQPSQAAA